ncbi:MAG TPA: hypothetical protein VFJ19_06270 [Nocardioidaceae bacterium]|nr:hypothetical protein [Nocardioidaceae bacterium]
MTELPGKGGFTELAERSRIVARDTVAPPFETLTARAHSRRRRQVLAVVAATVVVVAGVGAAVATGTRNSATPQPVQTPTTPATPSPVTPTSSPSPSSSPSTARQKLAKLPISQVIDRGKPTSYAVDAAGHTLAVWQLCRRDHCRYAYALNVETPKADNVLQGYQSLGADWLDARSADGRFVVVPFSGKGFVVNAENIAKHPHGDTHTTTLRHVASGSVRTGDIAVSTEKGWMVVDPSAATEWPVDTGQHGELVEFAVVSGGTLWAESRHRVDGRNVISIDHLTSDGRWIRHTIEGTLPEGDGSGLVVSGDHVVAITGPNGVDATVPDHFTVSSDGGSTWTQVPRRDLPFDTIESWAATSGGTLYVAEAGGHLWRSTDDSWTHFEQVPGQVSDLQPSGRWVLGRFLDSNRVIAQLGDSGHAEPLQVR